MKKILVCFVVLLIIVIAFMLIRNNADESASVHTEEEIENALVKSMEETKREQKKLEEFLTKTSQELNDNGYEPVALSYSDQNLTVQVQDKAFLEANKMNIEKIIHNAAKEIGFPDLKVDYLTLDSLPALSEEEEKERESIERVYEEISALLSENGYLYYSISTNPNNEVIIEIEGTKEELKKSKEIEQLIAQTILSKTNLELDIKLRKRSESAILDQEWGPVLNAISVETEKEFEDYRGFAYSFHPEPLQIIIKTNIDSPKWFGNSDRKIDQITKYVDKIIELKREEHSVEEIPYEIIIRDKNDKKIN
ncbi:hypothetical protein [Ureibacillus sp. GCM10028918]|uniref:hypothetical protein n=1 Tax=Ureibacillus sp. GCM10028918 TaxID=3273429 RepID=UPI003621D32F